MEVQFIYKDNSFVFTISPLMPISYLRTLSQKSFNIPENIINLSYQNINIEKQYNETSLQEYFKKKTRIIIKVSEAEQKNFYKGAFNSTNASSTIKSLKLIQEEKKPMKKNFDIFKTRSEINLKNNEENKYNIIKDKCQNCKKEEIDYFCRDECKFICKGCKNLYHLNHKIITLEKGNIEQCGYFYKKELIKDIKNQEKEIKELIEKSSKERVTEKIEEVYDIIGKISDLEREIIEDFPCKNINYINSDNYNEIKKKIFSLHDNTNFNKKNPYSFYDKISFFKELQNEELEIKKLKKEIDFIKIKYDFQDLLLEILEHIGNKFNYFHENLSNIWNENKNNLLGFSNEIGIFIKNMKKIFKCGNLEKDDKNSEIFDSEIEEILFENKLKNDIDNIPKVILPKLVSSSKNFNLIKNEENPLFKSERIEKKRRTFISSEKILDLNNNSTNEKDMNLNIHFERNNIKKSSLKDGTNRNKSNKKVSYSNIKEEFKLDQILLTDDNAKKSPNRPRKRNSIRMSVFTQGMTKVDSSNTIQLMKVKKKKKKF